LLLPAARTCDFHEGIDEKAQADLRRQTARRHMRRIDQAQMLQIAHHIANGGRRERMRQQAGQIARTDRVAVVEIALDDQPENFTRPLVERIQKLMFRRFHHDRAANLLIAYPKYKVAARSVKGFSSILAFLSTLLDMSLGWRSAKFLSICAR